VFHIVLILLTVALFVMAWFLVQSAPRVLSRILPPGLTFGIGLTFFVLGLFCSFWAAFVMRSPDSVLGCFVQIFVGLWFMLSTSSGLRGSESDHQMLKRIFGLIGVMMLFIIATLFVPDPQLIAVFNLLMVTAGVWIATNYFQLLDRGPR
jgi:hypothetical protein